MLLLANKNIETTIIVSGIKEEITHYFDLYGNLV